MTKREDVISLFKEIGDSFGRRILLTKLAVTDKELEGMISSGKVKRYEVERLYPSLTPAVGNYLSTIKWLKDKGYVTEGDQGDLSISPSARNAIRSYWSFTSEERFILRKAAKPSTIEPLEPKVSREKIRHFEPLDLAIWFMDEGFRHPIGKCFYIFTKSFLPSDVKFLVKILWLKFGIWSKVSWFATKRPAIYIPRSRKISRLTPRRSAESYYTATAYYYRQAQIVSKDFTIIWPSKDFQEIITPYIDLSTRERKLFSEWLDEET